MTNDGSSCYCGTCSETTSVFIPHLTVLCHRNEDSAEWRASVDNESHKYPCHTCLRSYHSYDISSLNRPWTCGRIPVLTTSSTLYQWQGARHRTRNLSDPFHIERILVSGATVRGVGHAIVVAYFDLGIPIDILLCTGLNDVMAGTSAFEIMRDFVMLQEAVCWRLPSSTVSFCTLPLPPKLCRFPGDKS